MTSPDLPVHVQVLGSSAPPHAEVFVLLHGYGASSFSWRHWVPGLVARGRVILIDLKGFGSAPAPDDGRYGPADQAELVHEVLRRLDLVGVTIIGHSMGGGVALFTAIRLLDEGRDRLRRLVLVAGAAYRQPTPPFMLLARFRRLSTLALRMLGSRTVAGQVLRSIVYDPRSVTASQIEGYAAPLARFDTQRALIDTGLQLLPPDLDAWTARYREIGIPTLLMWGRGDRVVPLWIARRLRAELPLARIEILERCGHLPAEEHPEESLASLLRFVDTTVSLWEGGSPKHLAGNA